LTGKTIPSTCGWCCVHVIFVVCNFYY